MIVSWFLVWTFESRHYSRNQQNHLDSYSCHWLMDTDHQIACSSERASVRDCRADPSKPTSVLEVVLFFFWKLHMRLHPLRLCHQALFTLEWPGCASGIVHAPPACLLLPQSLVGLQWQGRAGYLWVFVFSTWRSVKTLGKKLLQPQSGSSVDYMIGNSSICWAVMLPWLRFRTQVRSEWQVWPKTCSPGGGGRAALDWQKGYRRPYHLGQGAWSQLPLVPGMPLLNMEGYIPAVTRWRFVQQTPARQQGVSCRGWLA